MNKKIIIPLFSILLYIVLVLLGSKAVQADTRIIEAVPTPTILSAAQIEEATSSQIQVNGLATPGYTILIYINGNFDGEANVSQINSNTSKFFYLSLPYPSNQQFEISAIAKDQNSDQLSAPANAIVRSIIKQSVLESAITKEAIQPAIPTKIYPPILLTPSQVSCVLNPYISGFAVSNSLLDIYIDNNLFYTLTIDNKSSSTSFFGYSPAKISRGWHFVYAISRVGSGLNSGKSNMLSFCVNLPQITASSTYASSTNEGIPNIIAPISRSSTSAVFQKTNINNSSSNAQKGIFNYLIFFLFIAGLIIWMIIVNRELNTENTELIDDHVNDKQTGPGPEQK
jgi:hypothetical protein